MEQLTSRDTVIDLGPRTIAHDLDSLANTSVTFRNDPIGAYEQAVLESPDWQEAQENLELARYTRDYIFDLREASDTGDETELSADDYKFDNTENRGRDMTITKESTMELAAAEMWMRSVDTDTRDFLQSRFLLEKAREAAR